MAKENIIKINTKGYSGVVEIIIPTDVCVPSLNSKDVGYISYTYRSKSILDIFKKKFMGRVKSMSVKGNIVIFVVEGKGTLYVKINAIQSGTIVTVVNGKEKNVNVKGGK
jgi:hypothetical protein